MVLVPHAVDEGDAVALVFESRVGERLPAPVLALIDTGWSLRPDRNEGGAGSHRYCGGYCIRRSADH